MDNYTEDQCDADTSVQADVCGLLERAAECYQEGMDAINKAKNLAAKAVHPDLKAAIEFIDHDLDYAEGYLCKVECVDLWDLITEEP